MRRQRRALPPATRAQLSRNAAHTAPLWRAPFARARTASAYIADDGELDPAPLVARLRAAGKRVYVPVFRGKHMWFAPFERGNRLVKGRFGLWEPAGISRRLTSLRSIDLALVPLVAIDSQGNRLGRGGGFYDRAFGRGRSRTRWRRPSACGFAYAFQQVNTLSSRPWDAPIEYLLTEKRFTPLPASDTA